jgi:hypothetical protein
MQSTGSRTVKYCTPLVATSSKDAKAGARRFQGCDPVHRVTMADCDLAEGQEKRSTTHHKRSVHVMSKAEAATWLDVYCQMYKIGKWENDIFGQN